MASLRPTKLSDFIGQEHIKDVLQVALDAAKKQARPLDHVLLNGPPGLGKTTLARIIANELRWKVKTTIGSSVKTAKDVQSLAFSIGEKGKMILFIDEVHRTGKPAQEVLYPILEDGVYYYKLGYSVTEIKLGPYTMIGATTNMGKLEQPFVDRFGLHFQMEYYTEDEISRIVMGSMDKLGMKMPIDSIVEVAMRCRFTPRIANNILKRLRDYNVARGIELTPRNVQDILWKKFHLDDLGLTPIDRRVLKLLDKAQGPVGVQTIAAQLNEEADSIESKVEPFLLRSGLITRAMRGRMITDAGREHLGSINWIVR
jgi:Holliday junction DNA helicase RuvB